MVFTNFTCIQTLDIWMEQIDCESKLESSMVDQSLGHFYKFREQSSQPWTSEFQTHCLDSEKVGWKGSVILSEVVFVCQVDCQQNATCLLHQGIGIVGQMNHRLSSKVWGLALTEYVF